MSFLLGKKVKAISINHPLGKLNTKLVPERMKLLEQKLSAGDESVIDEIVSSHYKILINIAGQYARARIQHSEDLVSEALCAASEVCRDLLGKEIKSITASILAKAHGRCLAYIRKDKSFEISDAGRHERKKANLPELPIMSKISIDSREFVRGDLVTPDETKLIDLIEAIESCAETPRQKAILKFVLKGHTLVEVAHGLQMNHRTVAREMEKIRECAYARVA